MSIYGVFGMVKEGFGKSFGSGDVQAKKYGVYKSGQKKGADRGDNLREEVTKRRYEAAYKAEVARQSTPEYQNKLRMDDLTKKGYVLIKDASGKVTEAYKEDEYRTAVSITTDYRTSKPTSTENVKTGKYKSSIIYFNPEGYKIKEVTYSPYLSYKDTKESKYTKTKIQRYGIFQAIVHDYDEKGRELRFRRWDKPVWDAPTYETGAQLVQDEKYRIKEAEGGYYHIPLSRFDASYEGDKLTFKKTTDYQSGETFFQGFKSYKGYPIETKEVFSPMQTKGTQILRMIDRRTESPIGGIPSLNPRIPTGWTPEQKEGTLYSRGLIVRTTQGKVVKTSPNFSQYQDNILSGEEAYELTSGSVSPKRYVAKSELRKFIMGSKVREPGDIMGTKPVTVNNRFVSTTPKLSKNNSMESSYKNWEINIKKKLNELI